MSTGFYLNGEIMIDILAAMEDGFDCDVEVRAVSDDDGSLILNWRVGIYGVYRKIHASAIRRINFPVEDIVSSMSYDAAAEIKMYEAKNANSN
jgi:hypothetical protein